MNARRIVASLMTALVMAAPAVMAQAGDKKPERSRDVSGMGR
jgi:hypothetical protein